MKRIFWRSTAASTLKRIGEPHDTAGAAVFCQQGGGTTTGQTIVRDGGATISGGA